MNLRDKLQSIWDNRDKIRDNAGQIAEGWYNRWISHNEEIKAEAQRRMDICKGCEYYNKEGDKEIVVVKGQPACLLCGCNIGYLTAAMSATCSATKIGLPARWEAIMTEEQAKEVNAIEYKKQFEKPTE